MKKIKNKLFSTRKMAIFFAFIFLAVSGIIFFSVDYFAKGATYGWLQATWSGGVDTVSVANHTSNQSGWTKFFSKDTNVDTGSDELTLSSGSSSVTDTTTTQFNAGTWSVDNPCITANTAGDQMTGTRGCYDATPYGCGNFHVLASDRVGTADWTTAMSYCDSLCPTCDLPNSTELVCICNNKASFGNNFGINIYWSATGGSNITEATLVYFDACIGSYGGKTSNRSVRCVRR